MIKRINFTGRSKILREDARISVCPETDGVLAFDATLDLAEYGLPGDARVFVEAYRWVSLTFMRFEYGTVAAPRPQGGGRLRLSAFPTSDGLLFRVKVTSVGERAGVLLAEADRIPISDDEEQPDHRIALLPPLGEDLGQETWRVNYDRTSGPVLLVNNRLGDWKAIAASPLFRSLVYPAAMREVLWRVYKIEETRDMDDHDSWGSRWLRFASSLPGVGRPPVDSNEDDAWDDWITDAVDSFARKHQMVEHYRTFIAREGSL